MALYERSNAPLNRRTACKYLLLLFPELKKKNVEALLTKLLRAGELEPNEKRERADVGGTWRISYESWERFETRTRHQREEVRKKQVEKNEELLRELIQKVDNLARGIEKLQVEVNKRDKEEQVKEEIMGH